jgi:hypothetical protein
LSRQLSASANRRFEFNKRRQFFIRTHNEALIVAAMGVSNEDRSSALPHVMRLEIYTDENVEPQMLIERVKR